VLLTMSTAVITVLHSAELVHFHPKSRKSSEELWTQPLTQNQHLAPSTQQAKQS
jgi:hypothetical protein